VRAVHDAPGAHKVRQGGMMAPFSLMAALSLVVSSCIYVLRWLSEAARGLYSIAGSCELTEGLKVAA
jgi:hypothetical protein